MMKAAGNSGARADDLTRPRAAAALPLLYASAMIVGMVVGIGVFKTPSIVAANSSSEAAFLALWLLGGALTVIGALCYAELASAYPHDGGEYHYLTRAYGRGVGFLFAWGRLTVMQTGAIAAVGFVFGDYMAQLYPLGDYGPALYAAAAVIFLSVTQLLGTVLSGRAQFALTVLEVGVVLVLAAGGLVAETVPAQASTQEFNGATGLALVFILLTYGGWNEAAYLSGEVRDARRNMVRILLLGTGLVIFLYMALNIALLHVFGLEGLRQTEAPLADMARQIFGPLGVAAVAFAVFVMALSTMNASIFTGARCNLALARSFPLFAAMSGRNSRGAPAAAILVQAAITLALIALGAVTRNGFQTMVEYTAPVFWTFMVLIGISLFIFRWREPETERPFRVPFYPLLPIIFCATSAYLIYSSLVYTGLGAVFGVIVLALGVIVFFLGAWRRPFTAPGE